MKYLICLYIEPPKGENDPELTADEVKEMWLEEDQAELAGIKVFADSDATSRWEVL